jgi:hypothetical protein
VLSDADLVDSSLLPCNFLQCCAKDIDVVEAEGGYAGYNGFRNNISAIICTTDADFKNGGIDLCVSCQR